MKKQLLVAFYKKKLFLKVSKNSQETSVLKCLIFNKAPGLMSLSKKRL